MNIAAKRMAAPVWQSHIELSQTSMTPLPPSFSKLQQMAHAFSGLETTA